MVKNLPAMRGNPGLIPGWGRSPGEGHGNPLQYSCLENPMDREAWWDTIHRVAESQTQLKRFSTHRMGKWQPTPVLLPGKSHGQKSLVDYSPWNRKESGMTERLHFHFHLLPGRCLPRRKQWQPTPVLLPGKSHGRRSLVGCSPWGHEESDTTEQLPFHFSLSCTGEGNGNLLQCSSQGQWSLVG